MTNDTESKKNPVARLRDRFFAKKEKISPSPEIKDTFKKDGDKKEKKDDSKDRAAKPRPPEADL